MVTYPSLNSSVTTSMSTLKRWLRSLLTTTSKQVIGLHPIRYRKYPDSMTSSSNPAGPNTLLKKMDLSRYNELPIQTSQALIFDTETFVTNGAFPVIGSALGSKSAYVWLAAEMVDPLLEEERVDPVRTYPSPRRPTHHRSQHFVRPSPSKERLQPETGTNLRTSTSTLCLPTLQSPDLQQVSGGCM